MGSMGRGGRGSRASTGSRGHTHAHVHPISWVAPLATPLPPTPLSLPVQPVPLALPAPPVSGKTAHGGDTDQFLCLSSSHKGRS